MQKTNLYVCEDKSKYFQAEKSEVNNESTTLFFTSSIDLFNTPDADSAMEK